MVANVRGVQSCQGSSQTVFILFVVLSPPPPIPASVACSCVWAKVLELCQALALVTEYILDLHFRSLSGACVKFNFTENQLYVSFHLLLHLSLLLHLALVTVLHFCFCLCFQIFIFEMWPRALLLSDFARSPHAPSPQCCIDKSL